MEVFNELVNFFGLMQITGDVSFVELVNYIIALSCAVFIVCFIIRSLFLICEIPSRLNW